MPYVLAFFSLAKSCIFLLFFSAKQNNALSGDLHFHFNFISALKALFKQMDVSDLSSHGAHFWGGSGTAQATGRGGGTTGTGLQEHKKSQAAHTK